MATNRVGDEMIKLMAEQGGGVCWSVCTFDGWMNDAAYNADVKLWKGMNPHPANRMLVGSSWLRRDDRFEQGLIHAHDTNGRARKLSLFTLKAEFHPTPREAGDVVCRDHRNACHAACADQGRAR